MFIRSIILSSFLFIPLFSQDCSSSYVMTPAIPPFNSVGDTCIEILADPVPPSVDCGAYWYVINYHDCGALEGSTPCGDGYRNSSSCQVIYDSGTSCPAGHHVVMSAENSQICTPDSPLTCGAGFTLNSQYNFCEPIPNTLGLANLNNDPNGCAAAGGYYFNDGTCNDRDQMLHKIFSNPNAAIGAVLYVGGLSISALGFLGAPATGGISLPAVVAGAAASAYGMGIIGFNNGLVTNFSNNNEPPSNDVMNGETRIKVLFKAPDNIIKPAPIPPLPSPDTPPVHTWVDDFGASPAYISSTDLNTGKTDQVVTIPPSVLVAMSDSSNVDKITQTLLNPIGLEGTQVSIYDYLTGTVTTTIHSSGSTSSNPLTTIKTSPFIVSQNPDGTVIAIPSDITVAPIVSGSGGGTILSVPSGTSQDNGNGNDYSGVLGSIASNTASTSSLLDSIKAFFSDGTPSAAPDNGTGQFSAIGGQVTGSFSSFNLADPLGLDGLSSPIQTASFSILGHTFVIWDQSTFNRLPLDLIRQLLLYIASLFAIIQILSGGI